MSTVRRRRNVSSFWRRWGVALVALAAVGLGVRPAVADDASSINQMIAKAKKLHEMIEQGETDQNLVDVAASVVVGSELYRDVIAAGGSGEQAMALKALRHHSLQEALERAKRELKVLKEQMPEALALLGQICGLFGGLDEPQTQIEDEDDPPNDGPGYNKECVLQCINDILGFIADLKSQAQADDDGSNDYDKLAAELDALKPFVKNMKNLVKDAAKRSVVRKEFKKARDKARNIAGIKDGASFTAAVCEAWDKLLNGVIELDSLLKPQQSQANAGGAGAASSQPSQQQMLQADLMAQSHRLVQEAEKLAAALQAMQNESALNDVRTATASLGSRLVVLRDKANGGEAAPIRQAYDEAKTARDKVATTIAALPGGAGGSGLPATFLSAVTLRLQAFHASLP